MVYVGSLQFPSLSLHVTAPTVRDSSCCSILPTRNTFAKAAGTMQPFFYFSCVYMLPSYDYVFITWYKLQWRRIFRQSLSTKHRTESLTHHTGNYPVTCSVSRPSGITLVKFYSLLFTLKTNLKAELNTKHRTKSQTHQTGDYPVTCFVHDRLELPWSNFIHYKLS